VVGRPRCYMAAINRLYILPSSTKIQIQSEDTVRYVGMEYVLDDESSLVCVLYTATTVC
jgi:hypothetical protein